MFLTNKDMLDLIELRHELHRHPEISGEEKETARRIRDFLEQAKPDRMFTDLGVHGVAAVYDSGKSGPVVLIRSELDALPIQEKTDAEYRSGTDGKGHLCGHDGHSTILTALALGLSRKRPETGSVVLLYQPAEETGAGAAAVIADPRFGEMKPELFLFSSQSSRPAIRPCQRGGRAGQLRITRHQNPLLRQDRARLLTGAWRLADAGDI
ncbi:metal-dependent amidase/aminoacylase/carboxypeptidase family protein [Agrobacterium sp. SORGH_AS 745]|nr:metal-dependent amidase/aminoacylase/carboxypeptidase family protein [Agrobacterium sp. SORGH_AS_0745]